VATVDRTPISNWPRGQRSWRARWLIVSTLGAVGFVVSGAGSAIALLITPLMTEFGWPNSLASTIGGAFSIGALLAAPAVGVAVDAVGSKLVLTLGALAASIGFLLASRSHAWYSMVIAFALVGGGCGASFYLPSTVVVTNWMPRQKSLGIGIVLFGASIGAAAFSSLTGWWIEVYGWRVALSITAALIAVTLPVILLIVRNRPAQEVRLGCTLPEKSGKHPFKMDQLTSPTFILAIVGAALAAIGMGAIYFHAVPVLIKAGYSAHLAGLLFGGTWLLSAVGSVALGALADRIGAKATLAAALLVGSLGTALLVGAGSAGYGVAYAWAFVFLWGTTANAYGQLVPVVFAERLGVERLGTLMGLELASAGVAGAAAPVLTGLLYDQSGDYRLGILLSALATFLAACVVLLITGRRQVVIVPVEGAT
jgi:MFS family permease